MRPILVVVLLPLLLLAGCASLSADGGFKPVQQAAEQHLAGTHHSFDMTVFMLIGGLGTLLGPLLGALMVPWLTQYLQFLQEYRFIIFGPILILLVIFMPQGIVGSWLGWRARRASRRSAADKAGETQRA